jgi:hypothetical protein
VEGFWSSTLTYTLKFLTERVEYFEDFEVTTFAYNLVIIPKTNLLSYVKLIS